jgi:lysine-specific demethylase/histidyl-hydroxylase NO66
VALERCVSMPAESFLEKYFNHELLHTPAAGCFTDLFSADAVRDLVGGTGLRTSSIQLVRGGKEFNAGGVTDSGDRSGTPPLVDTAAVRRALAAGYTLVLRSLHRFYPPVRRFAHELARDLGHPVQVDAIVTPPGTLGIDQHYDVEDSLILQIEGHRRWDLAASPIRDPLPAHAWLRTPESTRDYYRNLAGATTSVDLEPGDTLYLPGGTFHQSPSPDTWSIHLAVTVSRVTRYDLLTELVAVAAREPDLRSSVSLAALESSPATTREQLAYIARRLTELAETTDPSDLLWTVRRRVFQELTAEPLDVLPDSGKHRYRVRQGLQYRLRVLGNDEVELRTGLGHPRFSGKQAEVVRDVAASGYWEWPATLDPSVATRLLETLVEIGFVVRDPEHEA